VEQGKQWRVNTMNKPIYLLIIPLLFSAVFFLSDSTLAATDLQALIKQCDSCHGPNGQPTRGDVPALAGKPVSVVKEAMAQFYYFERHCPDKRPMTEKGTGSSTNMCSIASTLSDEEIMALAEFYHSQ